MNIRDHFLRMFAYDGWANRECLAAMRIAGSSSATIGRMAHVVSAEKLWLERLRSERQSLPVWPTMTIEEMAALVNQMTALWKNYLNQLPPSAFKDKIEYRNSKGERWFSLAEDILTHVLMHSAYHRGQIAMEMRAAGNEPAYTDFIHAVRQGLVE